MYGVKVGTANTSFGTITRNEQISFDKTTHKASKNYINADDLCAWRKGEIILKGAAFSEIVFCIENAYDVKLQYDAATFSNCQNSIRFNTKQSLTSVLELLKEIQGINYTIKGKNIMITGKKCT